MTADSKVASRAARARLGHAARVTRGQDESFTRGRLVPARQRDAMQLRVFVTGGAGFIGRNLIERLRAVATVLAPSHSELDLLDEVAVRQFFERQTMDAVVHAAVAPGHRNAKDPTNLVFKNTRMFFNLVRNARRFGKLIYLSSGAVYDTGKDVMKVPEGYFDTHVPSDESGFAKYLCAKYIERARNIVELRPFGVFGKYEDYEIRFISNAICKTLFDLPITLKQNRRFDYVCVDDLADVVCWFLTHNAKYKSYNVTPDAAVELEELARIVREVSGKPLEIRTATPGMGSEYSGDNRRLRAELPGNGFTPIREAIEKLSEWYRQNRPPIRREAFLVDK